MSGTSSRGDAAQRAERRNMRRPARAGLAVRITLGVCAVLVLAVGVLASVNLRAASTFNQATDALNEHLAAAAQETPDYGKLSTMQEQTDAQFRDAASAGVMLLPQIREAIAANAAVSGKLSQYVKDQLAAQNAGSDQQDQSSSNSSDESSSSSSGGGLTDEQRKQVEELLKANEQSTPAESDSTATDSSQSQTTNNTGNTSKPW